MVEQVCEREEWSQTNETHLRSSQDLSVLLDLKHVGEQGRLAEGDGAADVGPHKVADPKHVDGSEGAQVDDPARLERAAEEPLDDGDMLVPTRCARDVEL